MRSGEARPPRISKVCDKQCIYTHCISSLGEFCRSLDSYKKTRDEQNDRLRSRPSTSTSARWLSNQDIPLQAITTNLWCLVERGNFPVRLVELALEQVVVLGRVRKGLLGGDIHVGDVSRVGARDHGRCESRLECRLVPAREGLARMGSLS